MSFAGLDSAPGISSLPPLKTNVRDVQRLRQRSKEPSGAVREPLGVAGESLEHTGLRFNETSTSGIVWGPSAQAHASPEHMGLGFLSNNRSLSEPAQQENGLIPHAPSRRREGKSGRKRRHHTKERMTSEDQEGELATDPTDSATPLPLAEDKTKETQRVYIDRSCSRDDKQATMEEAATVLAVVEALMMENLLEHHHSRDDKQVAREKAAKVIVHRLAALKECQRSRRSKEATMETAKVLTQTFEPSMIPSLTSMIVSGATEAAVVQLSEKKEKEPRTTVPIVTSKPLHDQALLVTPEAPKLALSARGRRPSVVLYTPATNQVPICGPPLKAPVELDSFSLEIESPCNRKSEAAAPDFFPESSAVSPSLVEGDVEMPIDCDTFGVPMTSTLISMGFSLEQAEDAANHCATLHACLDWISADSLRKRKAVQKNAKHVGGQGKDNGDQTGHPFTDDEDPFESSTSTCASVSEVRTVASAKSEESNCDQLVPSVPSSPGEPSIQKLECPKGHKLDAFWTSEDRWSCSTCKKTFEKGTLLYGCRTCNYDECASCLNEKLLCKKKHDAAEAMSSTNTCQCEDSTKKSECSKTCPSSHNLRILSTPTDNWSCSKCRKKFPAGTTLFGCRKCNYDECSNCFQQSLRLRSTSVAAPTTPKSAGMFGFVRRFSARTCSNQEIVKQPSKENRRRASAPIVVATPATSSNRLKALGMEVLPTTPMVLKSSEASEALEGTKELPVGIERELDERKPITYSSEDAQATLTNNSSMLGVTDVEEDPKNEEKTKVAECELEEQTTEDLEVRFGHCITDIISEPESAEPQQRGS